jgi:predicted CxxxxCH...CXXCH cytochrome family protein
MAKRFLCMAVLLVSIMTVATGAQAATVGPKNPTAAVGTNWGTPTSSYTSNNAYATYAALTTQDYLRMTGFSMGVPANARIDGISVAIEGYNTNVTAGNRQIRVALTKDGTAAAGTPKTGVQLATADGTVSQGGAADLWGTTWTVAEINAAAFGVLVSDTNTTAGGTFNIDTVTVTVTYTLCNFAPTVTFAEADQTISTAGGSVGYTATILNNDPAGCPNYAFNLSVNETAGNTAGFNSSVAPGSVGPLAPGGSTTATLTVQHGTAVNNDTVTTTLSAAEASHTTGTSASRVTTLTLVAPCTRNAPTFSIMPADDMVKSGASAVYTLSVLNNDTATCAATTFNLALAAENDPGSDFNIPSLLSAATVNVAPGVTSTSVTLTVSSKATAVDGDNLTSQVTLSDAVNHNGMNQVDSVKTIVNNNPLLHNSISTNSSKWPIAQSGKTVDGWGIANAQYGAFTCGTCHARNTGNIKRVKTSVTAPTDTFPGSAVNFQSTSGANSFGDDGRAVKTASNMICEVCHSKTSVHRYDSSSIADFNHKNANQTDCVSCHPHKVGFKPLACDTCHGYPPTTLAGLVTGADATGSTTFGAHQKHAVTLGYACDNCHSNYVMPNGGDIDIHFSNFGSTTGTYTGQATATYNGSAGAGGLACNSVYCHSSGQSTDGASATPVYVAPTWTGGVVACGSCHGNIPATGSHASHVADATTECADCHTGAVEATTAPTAGHIDRVINVDAGTYTMAGAPGNGYGTCTASCHNTGRNGNGLTGTWGTTLNNCSECHPTVPATGGHGKHVGVSFNGVAMNCDDCHTGAVQGTTAPTTGHRDGNIDAVGYATANKALGSAFTTCNAASCHQDGLVNNTHYINTPAWDADTANCTQCHAAVPATGSHSKHVTTAGKDCSACHTGATKDTSYASAAHGDLNIDVSVGGYAANKAIASAYTNCTNLACHSDGMTATGNSPVWGNSAGCTACHLSNMTTGSHTKHLAEAGVGCGDCHADAVKDTTAPTGGVHVDGNVDVYNAAAGDLGYPNNVAYGSATWTTCTAASCHDKGRGGLATTPAWGVSKTDCTECHAGSAISTGSHATHIAAGSVCTDCHDAATNVATETEPAAGHRDTNIDTNVALGYTQNKGKDLAFTTCATASCHNDGRNNGLTGTWGTTLNNCSECHATVPTTGSHTDHMALYTCATCHTGTTQGTTAGAGHRDGNIDTAAATGLTADKLNGSAFTSCGTNNCHGSSSPVWGTNLDAYDACTQCHGQMVAGPATDAQKAPGGTGVDTNGDSAATDAQVGAHQIHLNPTKSKAVACSACHAVPATITTAGHIDSPLPAELTYSGMALGGLDGQAAVAPANSQAGCAATYCHEGAAIKKGWDGGTLAPTWTDTAFMSGTVADCDNCHGYPPAGSHVVDSDCSKCHLGMNADDLTFTAAGKLAHVDGVVQASADDCTACHAADVDGANNGVHAKHADVATFLAGKKVSTGGYGGAGWYTTVYVSGKPNYGCGECHPAAEGVSHPINGLNVDMDPAGETPTAGSLKLKNVGGPTMPTYSSRVSLTCNNIYCHSDAAATPTYKLSPNWYGGTVSGNCTECHGNSPTTNAHNLHAVGIHYDTLYDDDANGLMPSAAAPGTDAGAAHGNSATSDVIGCQSCHNSTVTVEYNSGNTLCATCHSDTNTPATGNEKAIISATGSTHVNGLPDVAFASLNGFKSKAQIRSDITSVAELNTNWTRTNNYKAAAGNSYDAGKAVVPGWNSGAKTCSTVECHNGIITPAWTSGSVGDCTKCHTRLP